MGLLGKLVSFGLGVYAGIYYSQNYDSCPKVEDPNALYKRLQNYLDDLEKRTKSSRE